MLPSKTIFIVGAGASQEVGLPVGAQLKKIISDKLNVQLDDFGQPTRSGDPVIVNVLRQRIYAESDAINRYFQACWRIRDGVVLSSSIDDFIDTHQEDRDIAVCSKLAIARSILEAERQSKLFYERNNIKNTVNFPSVSDTWYAGFYQFLSQGVTKANLDSLFENVTVISFNYDRCIEHFLVHAIAAHYHVNIDAARHLVEKKLTIFHPYGSVGSYFAPPDQAVEFGFKGIPDFDKVMKTLKTYTEQIEDKEDLRAIREAIIKADIIVFLGTAFHDNNIALLGDETYRSPNNSVMKRIYATRKGISDDDLSVVQQQLSYLCGVRPPNSMRLSNYFFAQKCRELFDQYRMSLRQ